MWSIYIVPANRSERLIKCGFASQVAAQRECDRMNEAVSFGPHSELYFYRVQG